MKRPRAWRMAKAVAPYGLTFSAVFGASSAVTLTTAPAAHAQANYWRDMAVWEAGGHSSNRPGDRSVYRTDFVNYPNDCVNFVSLSMWLGGGTGINDAWTPYASGFFGSPPRSWTYVPAFVDYQANQHYENGAHYAYMWDAPISQDVNPGWLGDAVVYHIPGNADYWVHTALLGHVQYYGTVVDPYDNYVSIAYNQYATAEYSHTADRQGVPWNIGWADAAIVRHDPDAKNWVAAVIHVNT